MTSPRLSEELATCRWHTGRCVPGLCLCRLAETLPRCCHMSVHSPVPHWPESSDMWREVPIALAQCSLHRIINSGFITLTFPPPRFILNHAVGMRYVSCRSDVQDKLTSPCPATITHSGHYHYTVQTRGEIRVWVLGPRPPACNN